MNLSQTNKKGIVCFPVSMATPQVQFDQYFYWKHRQPLHPITPIIALIFRSADRGNTDGAVFFQRVFYCCDWILQ